MWCCALLVMCVAISNAANEDEWRLVQTAQGPVRGRRESDGVYAFYNIPYATAPTGKHKFKAPLPPPRWIEPYDAIDKGVVCPQAASPKEFPTDIITTKTMPEDCLKANVYVPNTKEKNLAVLVTIHGGGFQVGFGDWLKAKTLMKKDIIVISFNYRLGIHGFLCLGTKDVPGNAGMKDMVALLRWVKLNIASFGGNPNDVTISGFSAGATAADLLILSKSAEGLFKKVIIESGASVTAFAIQSDPIENAKMHAKALNFTNVDDIYALEQFYTTASYDTLTTDHFFGRKDSTFLFSVCVERDTGEEVFLHDSPTNILKTGDFVKVPMLYGFTNMEGLFRANRFDLWKSAMNKKFSEFLPADLIFENDDQREVIAKQIKEFYFGYNAIDTDTILSYVDYFTDVLFASPALRSVSLNVRSGNNQIYLYLYSFVDENIPYVPHTQVRGATHCAQSLAIFDDLGPFNSTTEFTNIRKIMREMWHNFIITGKPVPEGSSLPFVWPPTSADRTPYMSFGQVVEVGGVLLEERGRFWEEIYKKHYREPMPPPAPSIVSKIQLLIWLTSSFIEDLIKTYL